MMVNMVIWIWIFVKSYNKMLDTYTTMNVKHLKWVVESRETGVVLRSAIIRTWTKPVPHPV